MENLGTRCISSLHPCSLFGIAIIVALVGACTAQRSTPLDAGEPVPGEIGGSGGTTERKDGSAPDDVAGPGGDSCVSTTRRCSKKRLEECQTAGWVLLEECSRICEQGACGGLCRPDEETRCSPDGKASEICAADGRSFVEKEACAGFCVGKACAACKPGDRKCDNTQPQLCSPLGVWENDGVKCTTGCNQAQGLCNGCNPDVEQKKCIGMEVWACLAAEKTWAKEKSCGAAEGCVGGACTSCSPGVSQPKCDNDRLVECGSDGNWKVKQDCAASNVSCVSGACGNCKIGGNQICKDKVPQVCEMGQWAPQTPCPVFCNNSDGRCRECVPNSTKCTTNPVALETCNSAGTSWAKATCTAPANATPVCLEDRKCDHTCNAGFNKCSDGTCRTACPGIQGLGDLSGGAFSSCAEDVNAPGDLVVGSSVSANGTEAFKWTSAGMVGLGDLAGGTFTSSASGVSPDGSFIVGSGDNGKTRPLIWKPGLTEIAPGFDQRGWKFNNVAARAVSNTGRAGGRIDLGSYYGFLWSEAAGVEPIGQTITDISAAGDVAVGANDTFSSTGAITRSPSIFTIAFSGFVQQANIPFSSTVPQNVISNEALSVSHDGTVVVGQRGGQAFRWVRSDKLAVDLGVLAGYTSNFLVGTNGDGAVAVGFAAATGKVDAAVYWSAVEGLKPLQDVLAKSGVELAGWTLTKASGVSYNGKVIVGCGTNPQGNAEAFRAVLP